jgi:hypothetical protein
MIQKWYSDLLHLHAAKWGLEVPEPRPLITDDTSPYPRLTVIETLTWRDTQAPHHHTEIALVTLNGLYSYTLNFQWRDHGRGYLPFLKFCDPFPTRADALDAAIADLKRADPPPEMRTWIHELTAPKQLSLF